MKKYILIACVSTALSIVLGAFGAHAWKELLTGHESTFDTGHLYHITQSIGLLALISIFQNQQSKFTSVPVILILIGMCFFSGSLYMLSFPEIFSGTLRSVLGPITPIGGLLMIIGWSTAAWNIIRK